MDTKDLWIKKACFEDWQDLYRHVWSREETARYMLWSVTTSEADARQRMERTLAWQSSHHAWTIYEKSTGKAIGFAGLMELEDGIWEDTGVALGPEYTGRGFGKQILRRLMEYVFDQQMGRTLICSCRQENAPSRRVITACGMTFTHCESRVDQRNGQPYVIEFYRLDRAQKATALAAATFKESTP